MKKKNNVNILDEIVLRLTRKKDEAQKNARLARSCKNYKDEELYNRDFSTFAEALIIIHEVILEYQK